MNPTIPIYVCCHQQCRLPDNELLVPIQAGRAAAGFRLDMAGDDSGENISLRNQNFCELSVLYWIWRNTEHDCFGLCHYRRFFNLVGDGTDLESLEDFTAQSGHTAENLQQLMESYDLIVPAAKSKENGSSLYKLYAAAHHLNDMNLALAIIRDVYPEMIPAAQNVIFKQTRAYYKNMMICRRDFADVYCRWLFDVLRRLDNLIYPQLDKRTPYQQRVYGFLGERLFNIFLEYYRRDHPLRIKEVPLLIYRQPTTEEIPLWQTVLSEKSARHTALNI